MPRLATCMMCAKIERMPDPPADVSMVPAKISYMDMGVERDYTFEMEDGTAIMVPEYDPLLEDFVGRHGHSRPDTDVMGFIKVFPVDQKTYEKMDVVTELKKELNDQTGLLFEEANYYKDEALKCYNDHKNPTFRGINVSISATTASRSGLLFRKSIKRISAICVHICRHTLLRKCVPKRISIIQRASCKSQKVCLEGNRRNRWPQLTL